MKVIVVDDDVCMTDVMGRTLKILGHDAQTFNDPREAVEMVRKSPPDILISDYNMPFMNGLKLMAACLEACPDLAVILMTANNDFDIAVKAMNGGATYFLTKSSLQENFKSALHEALKAAEFLARKAMARKVLEQDGTDTQLLPRFEFDEFGSGAQGAAIGQYNIQKKIGEGAAGIVFLCSRRGDSAKYAVKILKIHHFEAKHREKSIQRFINEGSAISQLHHPNIIQFFEFGIRGASDEAAPYIVMEFFNSTTLTEILNDPERLSLKDKLSIVRQVASGLDAVHGKGIFHRDVKPDNILVNEALHAKITDFGVCHLPTSDLTMTNHLLGTPSYISPESIQFGASDKLMDIYALGVVAYELFLGARPYEAKNFHDLVGKIINEYPIKPRDINPDFPLGLEVILAKMLKKNPKSRYQSAAELIADIDKFETKSQSEGLFDRITKLVLFSKDWR